MIDEEDTSPLRTRSDVPPELQRALRALQTERPSRSSLDQVAARLAHVLDAPPPVVPSQLDLGAEQAGAPTGWLLRGLGARAVALRVGFAALAIGATAVWLRPSAREHGLDAARTSAGVESHGGQAVAAGGPAGERGAGAGQALDNTGAARASAAQAAAAAEPGVARTGNEHGQGSHDAPGGRSRRSRARPGRVVSPTAAEAAGLARAPAAGADPAGSLADERRAGAVDPKPDAAVSPALDPAPQPGSARERSEVELLLEARRLAPRDPRAAQRLLEQHAARFPDGVLAPEREVLAIEVLRELGQTAAAEQRLRAFRVRHPNSMHLRRLSTPPASQGR